MRELPTIHFHRDWQTTSEGVIVAGGRVRVVYDADRLPSPRPFIEYGMPGWSITCCYRFQPGTDVHGVALFGVGSNDHAGELEIDVPHSARAIELWFYLSDRWGHRTWDSRYGENFRFPVVSINEVLDAAALRFNTDGSITVRRVIAPVSGPLP